MQPIFGPKRCTAYRAKSRSTSCFQIKYQFGPFSARRYQCRVIFACHFSAHDQQSGSGQAPISGSQEWCL